MPIFSTPPDPSTSLLVISNSLYFTEELPQFNTNIFITYFPPLFYNISHVVVGVKPFFGTYPEMFSTIHT